LPGLGDWGEEEEEKEEEEEEEEGEHKSVVIEQGQSPEPAEAVERQRAETERASTPAHMPGLLKRSHNAMMANAGNGAAVIGSPRKRQHMEMPNGAMHALATGLDGTSDPVLNCTRTNGVDASSPESALESAAMKAAHDMAIQAPPEIHHIVEGFIPLSRLVERLAQDAFAQLHDVIDELSEMPRGLPNGVGPASDTNTSKKTRLWEFVQEKRAKFIKLLVLSQWSRQAHDVSRVIDINHYLAMQKALYKGATAWVGELQRVLGPMKLPAGDLKTSMEVLSNGKADWIGDLGYMPLDPLTPKQMLRVMRDINTTLTIRLGVHESIPQGFEEYRVRDGRVTFMVKDEFELDLSIADDDPARQLFFVDFRFTFQPSEQTLPEGRARNEMEHRINAILGKDRLHGCYDFLHDLVLTQKMTTLRYQAAEMSKSRWSENVKMEFVHRSVVVQYWTNRPGGKNWIEIGIRRRRRKEDGISSALNTSRLSLRWHRHGKEVLDHSLEVNAADLNIETLLKEVLAAHTNYILRSTRRALRDHDAKQSHKTIPIQKSSHRPKKLFHTRLATSPIEPADSALQIRFATSHTEITLNQEPVSGSLTILPQSQLHARFERDLDRLPDPAKDAASTLMRLRAQTAFEKLKIPLTFLAWQYVPLNMTNESQRKFFGNDVINRNFFRPSGFAREFALGLTNQNESDVWWLVELTDSAVTEKRDQPKNAAERARREQESPIRSVVSLGPDLETVEKDSEAHGQQQGNFEFLEQLRTKAGALASRLADSRILMAREAKFKVNKRAGLRKPAALIAPSPKSLGTPDMWLNYSSLSKNPVGAPLFYDPVLVRTLWPRSQSTMLVTITYLRLNQALRRTPDFTDQTYGSPIVTPSAATASTSPAELLNPATGQLPRVPSSSQTLASGFISTSTPTSTSPITKLLRTHASQCLAFSARTSTIAFLLRRSPTFSCIPDLLEGLRRIERLFRFLYDVEKLGLRVREVGLDRVLVAYSDTTPAPSASPNGDEENVERQQLQVRFDLPLQGALRVTFPGSIPNPHRRIATFLDSLLAKEKDGIHLALLVMQCTLPLLRVFDQLERLAHAPWNTAAPIAEDDEVAGTKGVEKKRNRPTILARGPVTFRVQYPSAIPCQAGLKYDICLKKKVHSTVGCGGNVWFFRIDPASSSLTPSLSDISVGEDYEEQSIHNTFAIRFYEQLCTNKGPGWEGVGKGIVADVDDVAGPVWRIDAIVQEMMAAGNTRDTGKELNGEKKGGNEDDGKNVNGDGSGSGSGSGNSNEEKESGQKKGEDKKISPKKQAPPQQQQQQQQQQQKQKLQKAIVQAKQAATAGAGKSGREVINLD